MFEELMDNLIKERNNLFDGCVKNLIELAGYKLPENQSQFELVMLADEMKGQGYQIQSKIDNNKQKIYLIKMEDLHEEILAGYEIDVKAEDNKVSIVATYFS